MPPISKIDHFRVLDNDTRRRIILYVQRERVATFTQIMHFLELDPLWQCGTIGYHLNLLVSSGVLSRHADGYILTGRGSSLAEMIMKVRDLGGDKMKDNSKPEGILKRLNPRSVCWLLAVAREIKPTATILSVAREDWVGFLRVLGELGLCWSYKGIDGVVLTCQKREAERLFGDQPPSSDVETISLLFDNRNWRHFVSGKKSDFKTLDSSSAKLTPVIFQDPNVAWEVSISRNLRSLLSFAQFNQRTNESACFSNHIMRGKALGYPECCIEAFNRGGRFGLVARHNLFKELIDLGLDDCMPVEFWAIAHVPCSAKCEESLRLGRDYLDAVKSYSPSLYEYVLERLQVSYLAYSVGERFLGFKEIPLNQYTDEFRREYERILKWSEKIVTGNVRLVLGDVQRPLVYADWEDFPVRCRLVPDLMGLKWIAYSPGEGMLVRDTETNEVYLYGMLRWMLPSEYEDIMDTVCRVYKCR